MEGTVLDNFNYLATSLHRLTHYMYIKQYSHYYYVFVY